MGRIKTDDGADERGTPISTASSADLIPQVRDRFLKHRGGTRESVKYCSSFANAVEVVRARVPFSTYRYTSGRRHQ